MRTIKGGKSIKSFSVKFFWILLIGVVFFFGFLTYLIFQREKSIILDFYKEKSLQTADIIVKDLLYDMMLKDNPLEVINHINAFNQGEELKVGIVGPNGLPAFNTNIAVPKEVFSAQKELHLKSKDELVFFKPLKNENRCHACHSPGDETRGMIVVKTSMKRAYAEVAGTARRLIFFAVVIGLISELFLIVVLRRMILKPLSELNKGAEILRSGKLDHRIGVGRNDEVGELASCFNGMAETIEKAHANLENAVRQKTKELRVIAELSSEVFKGDISLTEIIDHFLSAITEKIGYRYSALCLIDKETGLLMQEFKRGIANGLCDIEISVASDHPFIKTIREARPAIKKSDEIGMPDSFGNVVLIPVLSHQRKRCRETNLCTYENCPAFDTADERCWLISDTLCRSPQAVAGREKIYGCLHCDVFPVYGVLIAGREQEISKTSLHSLEILASEIASAIENRQLIDGKKNDINSLIKLHDISVEAIQNLDIHALAQSIVSSATVFANMDSAILYLKRYDQQLYFTNASSGIEKEFVPESFDMKDSFIGKALIEERAVETVRVRDVECFKGLIAKYGFLYIAAIPLKFKGFAFGCLTLFKKKDFFMTDSEKAIISLFASQSAGAINTARIYNELRVEKEFSDVILSNMSMGVMVFDKEDKIVKLNPAAFDILKISDYVVGMKLKDFLPQASDFLIMDSSIGREIDVSIGENTIPLGFSNSPIFDASGKQTGTVVVFRDLTEIKKLQTEVRRKHHFEAMGKIIAGVAHEIRNPLFGISSIVQILEKEVESGQHRSLLQATLKEIYRLKNLVDELLLYSRPSNLNITAVDLKVLMERIEHYINAKKDSVALNLEIQPSVMIRGDQDKLTQVFLNLIDNALAAGCNRIDITAEKREDCTVLTVNDNGAGIKGEAIEKVFDPFFTTKKEGTGLGLSICKKIIEDHGWDIGIHSAESKGTSVRLTLPD